MIFSFNEKIRKYLKDDCHVLMRDNIDNQVINYVIHEAFTYYVLSNNSETHVRDLLNDIENTTKFYRKSQYCFGSVKRIIFATFG